MNQYKYKDWTIQWEGAHEDYSKGNKFVLLDNEMGQIMVQVTFNEEEIEFKSMLVDSVKVDPTNKIITIISMNYGEDDFVNKED